MRYGRIVVGLAIVVASIIAGLVMSSCATVPHKDPLYDGEIASLPDSTTLIRLTIQNDRTLDATDPHFYLVGNGRHSLGIIGGMGTRKILFVDTRWFSSDGCMVVIAHYVGLGDWTSPRVCWRPGQVIDVLVQNIWATGTAWSHT